MAAVISLEQLAQTTLTPKPAADMRQKDAVTEKTADKLAALPPADDAQADLPEPPVLSSDAGRHRVAAAVVGGRECGAGCADEG